MDPRFGRVGDAVLVEAAMGDAAASPPSMDLFFSELSAAVLRKRHADGFSADLRGRFDVLSPAPPRSWLLDLRAEAAADRPVVELPQMGPGQGDAGPVDFSLTCESGEALLDALKGKREFMLAVAQRKVRAQGNLAKLTVLKEVFAGAASTAVDGNGGSGNGGPPMLVPLPKSEWEPDGPACSQCQARFSLTNRRHHCRFCGSLCCADCTRFRLGPNQKRACMLCHLAVQRARRDFEENGDDPDGASSSQQTSPRFHGADGLGTDYGVDMTERMLTLESRLGHLERQRRVGKARLLLRCADWAMAAQTASLLLAGLLLGHYAALLAGERGWNATGVAWVQGLMVVPSPASSSSSSYLPPWLIDALRPGSGVDTCYGYWAILLGGVGLAGLVAASTLYRRSVTAFSVAAVLIVAIELTKLKVKRKLAHEQERVWEEANYIYGAFLRLAFFRLKGSYIKMAQYISSRADIVPDAFADELSALQDAVPPSSLAEVKPLIERALKQKLSEAFFSFEGEALASASIAQVHRAVLKDGTDVVVKVQHPDVARLLSIDLRNIQLIFGAIAWLEPDYDFTMVAKEWATEVRKELDFRTEATNLERAYDGIMRRSGIDAVVPQPLSASANVLVMTYCPGVKVTDPKAFASEEEKAAYMKALCEVFAYGCYVQGFYNADPHPGNLFVQALTDPKTGERRVRPVVLDWGMAKTLPERVRVGNARIVLSVWELDVAGMLDGMRECGMPVERIDILEDLGNIRFLMRNTAPGEESREESKRFAEAFMEKQKLKPKSERNPLKSMVPEVLFLARVTEMLQGLGAKLGVRVPYLHIMACGCKRALLERSPTPAAPALLPNGGNHGSTKPPQRIVPRPLPPPTDSPSSAPPLSFLDQKVHALLQDLLAEGHGVGAQVVLYKNGRMLVHAACGLRSRLDPGRVTPDTLFCGFSLTKCLLALLAHALVEDGRLAYDAPLAEACPALFGGSKQLGGVTLRQLLSHRAGLQYAWPEPEDASPQKLWEPQAGEAAILGCRPVGPASKPSLHYYAFGWALVPVLEAAGGKPIGQLLKDRLLAPLGLDPSSLLLGPVPGTAALASGDDPRLATVEYDLRQMLAEAAGVDPSDPNLGMPGGGGMEEEGVVEGEEGGEAPSALLGLVEGLVEGEEERRALRDMVGRRLKGREMLLDHRMLNARRLRQTGALPSLSGRVTAKGLADVLEALCRVERSAGPAVGSGSGNGVKEGKQQHQHRGANGSGSGSGSSSSRSSSTAPAFGINGSPRPVLSPGRLRALRADPMEEQPGLTRLVGREHPIVLGCGVQLFGFEHPAASAASVPAPQDGGRGARGGDGIPEARSFSDLRGAAATATTTAADSGGNSTTNVRWGPAYGHAAACGQLALCDPSNGVVLVVTGNKAGIPGQKNVGYEVLKLVAEELHLGKPLPIW